ncbi:MAG: NADP-dependent oxidoreductase [candidate division NC10 bacterium]|nr:NADP-dependent oxidoreductase [candidate division NC10 bacterium]
MNTMKAVQINSFGPESRFILNDVPIPRPTVDQVLIKVEAAALNPLDNIIRLGHFPIPAKLPHTLGTEGAGIVAEASEDLKKKERVFISGGGLGIFAPGTFAQYVAVDRRFVRLIPDFMGFDEAAAFGLVSLTAWLALRDRAGLKEGDRALILGGGGGVGHMAIQLARNWGAHVIATFSHPAKVEKAFGLGAHQVIDLSKQDLVEEVHKTGHGIDIVLDMVGGDLLPKALIVLNPRARVISVGYSGGAISPVNVVDLLRLSAEIRGFNIFMVEPGRLQEALGSILADIQEGRLKVLIDKGFPFSEAQEAFQYLLSRKAFGKIVLRP